MRELTEAEKKLFCLPMAELLDMRNRITMKEANLTWIINKKKKTWKAIDEQKRRFE